MSDQLLTVLRVCLLVLVYLVFLRVLRAVWAELRSGASAPSPLPSPPPGRNPVPAAVAGPAGAGAPSGSRMVVVAPAGLMGLTFELDPETTIGRAGGCRISIDDDHVSKLHARVYHDRGDWYVEDLGSTNGTYLNDVAVTSPVQLRGRDQVRVGRTVLELA